MPSLRSLLRLFAIASPAWVVAADFFVSPTGVDTNAGTIDHPFATVMAAQAAASAGDTVFLRGGTYALQTSDITHTIEPRAIVNYLTKNGIRYIAYPSERPIFDFSQVRPVELRVSAFYIEADDCVFEGFDVVGVQITIAGRHTQSTCFVLNGGNRNRFENLAMRNGMGIGWYLIRGGDNLVLNCDAFENKGLDAGSMGNIDGFGAHPQSTSNTGNRFVGCRAWFNSDDGFDLINADAAVTIERCWSFYNGYDKDFNPLVDGHGFKAGGYGRNGKLDFPNPPPVHRVRFSLAVGNKTSGFYANHHTGRLDWIHNTAIRNPVNFNLLCTLASDNSTDVPGFDQFMRNNLGFNGNTEVSNLNEAASDVVSNYFTLPVTVTDDDFASLDEALLTLPRQADGSLPEIAFARLRPGSDLIGRGVEVGVPGGETAPDLGAFASGREDLQASAEATEGGWEVEWRGPAGWPYVVFTTSDLSQPLDTWYSLTSGELDRSGSVSIEMRAPISPQPKFYLLELQ